MTHDTALNDSLAELDREIKLSFETQKTQEEAHAISKIKEDPRFFFKYANSKRKTKGRIGPLKTIKYNKQHIENGPKEMAEILSEQYKSVFTKPTTDKQVLDPRSFFTTNSDSNIP